MNMQLKESSWLITEQLYYNKSDKGLFTLINYLGMEKE